MSPFSVRGSALVAVVLATLTATGAGGCASGSGDGGGRSVARDEPTGQGESMERAFRVHGTTLDVTARWGEGAVRLVLTAPSGRRIDRDTDTGDVTGEVGPTFESLHVRAPEPGTWTAALHGDRVTPDGEQARIVVRQGASVADGPTARLTQELTGRTVVVDGSRSSGSGGEIARYVWEFGDGATSERERVSHTYRRPGTYRVSLAVQDERGRWGVVTAPSVLEVR